MNANDIKFRCSSLGHLMTEARSKSEPISETTKTHLVDVFVSNKYNRHEEINSKFLTKGIEVEEDSITLVSRIHKKIFFKNTERLSNEFITGEPDLFVGESIYQAEKIIDTKSSWSAYSFFRAKYKDLKKMYYYQGLGYMWLTGANECSIEYCLNNTPVNIIDNEIRKESYNYPENEIPEWAIIQIIANHIYDYKTFEWLCSKRVHIIDDLAKKAADSFIEIPINERHFNIEFKRNDEDIKLLQEKIVLCREWMNKNLFDDNSQGQV